MEYEKDRGVFILYRSRTSVKNEDLTPQLSCVLWRRDGDIFRILFVNMKYRG